MNLKEDLVRCWRHVISDDVRIDDEYVIFTYDYVIFDDDYVICCDVIFDDLGWLWRQIWWRWRHICSSSVAVSWSHASSVAIELLLAHSSFLCKLYTFCRNENLKVWNCLHESLVYSKVKPPSIPPSIGPTQYTWKERQYNVKHGRQHEIKVMCF